MDDWLCNNQSYEVFYPLWSKEWWRWFPATSPLENWRSWKQLWIDLGESPDSFWVEDEKKSIIFAIFRGCQNSQMVRTPPRIILDTILTYITRSLQSRVPGINHQRSSAQLTSSNKKTNNCQKIWKKKYPKRTAQTVVLGFVTLKTYILLHATG